MVTQDVFRDIKTLCASHGMFVLSCTTYKLHCRKWRGQPTPPEIKAKIMCKLNWDFWILLKDFGRMYLLKQDDKKNDAKKTAKSEKEEKKEDKKEDKKDK